MAGSQLGNLESFISTVTETNAAYQQANAKLEKLNNGFDKAEDELEDKIDGLKDAVATWTEEFVNAHQENLTGLDTLIETAREHHRPAPGGVHRHDRGDREDRQRRGERPLGGHRLPVREPGERGLPDRQGRREGDRGHDQGPRRAGEGRVQRPRGPGREPDRPRVEWRRTRRSGRVRARSRTTSSDTLTEAVEQRHGRLPPACSTGGESLSSGLDTVMNLLTEGFDMFSGESGNIGDMLMQMGADILSEAASNITEALMSGRPGRLRGNDQGASWKP